MREFSGFESRVEDLPGGEGIGVAEESSNELLEEFVTTASLVARATFEKVVDRLIATNGQRGEVLKVLQEDRLMFIDAIIYAHQQGIAEGTTPEELLLGLQLARQLLAVAL